MACVEVVSCAMADATRLKKFVVRPELGAWSIRLGPSSFADTHRLALPLAWIGGEPTLPTSWRFRAETGEGTREIERICAHFPSRGPG